MTPLPVIANVYRVACNWSNDANSQIAENVIHVLAPDSTDEAVGTQLDSNATGTMFEPMANNVGCQTFSITKLDGTSATYNYTLGEDNWIGGTAGDFSPASSCVVAFATGERGRSKRGRVYLPFIAEAAITDGSMTAGLDTTVSEAWAAFQDALSDVSMTLVVASYKLVEATAITGFSVKSAIGTQRRRQTRVRYP